MEGILGYSKRMALTRNFSIRFSGTERCPQKGVVKQVATKLVQALSEKGLALLVNHGIPDCKVHTIYYNTRIARYAGRRYICVAIHARRDRVIYIVFEV